MSRLIDADELKDAWWNPETGMGDIIANLIDELDLNDVEDDVMAFSRKLLEIVNNFVDTEPTVDAVEVVRCKHCTHRAKVDEPNICGACKLVNRYRDGDDYCSYGEREDGAE